jgi:predicted short-subunit dehydrogenase-like oxidoreductase (DUF2520 family)
MKQISIIGTGNVATHLATALHASGVTINQVFGRNQNNLNSLAKKVNATPVSSLLEIDTENVDAVIISVKDDVIEEVANQLAKSNTIFAHTSGTVRIEALKNHQNRGVFYPLQTFSKSKEMDLSDIPFCIEGSNRPTKLSLLNLATVLSNDVRFVDSDTRKSLHIAAVFASNFSNHMLAISEKLLKESGQDLSILKPLVTETISKAFSSNPVQSQTGPANRNDLEVMRNHLAQLENEPLQKEIYALISESIKQFKNE